MLDSSWLYGTAHYWTSTTFDADPNSVFVVFSDGEMTVNLVDNTSTGVRPVITLPIN